jgi:hypothetical protein
VTRTPLRRSSARCASIIFAASAILTGVASAQQPSPEWSWPELRAIPRVDSAHVAWLEANLDRAEASRLFSLLARLSSPAAAQLLPSLAHLEGTVPRAFIDSMAVRPPGGRAGAVRVAYLLARERHSFLAGRTGVYARTFTGRAFELPAASTAAGQPGAAVTLALDFAPAESLLALVSTRNIDAAQALARISTPAFDALITHHGQDFYPRPLTREQLALNLVHAASDAPLDQLYRYARPGGLYHFADVRENADRYRALMRELRANEPALSRHLSAALTPYLPRGTTLQRRVSFYFNDLSDGWGVGTIAAVPLEYYKDDWARMINTMVHETFHAAQSEVSRRSRAPVRALRDGLDTALSRAAQTLLIEGTANFIAPAIARSPSSADSMSQVGARLLTELASMRSTGWDASRAQAILNHGVASAGPFYWLGASMARALVARSGTASIGRALQSDGLAFVAAYLDGVDAERSLIAPPVAEAVRPLVR